MTLLSETRLDPRDEADLLWLWNESAGALGLRSNLGALVAHCQGLSGNADAWSALEAVEGRMEAVERQRRVLGRLARLTPDDRRVLRHAYTPELWHQGAAALGRAPGVAALTLAARDAYAAALDVAAWRSQEGPAGVLSVLRRAAAAEARQRAEDDHAAVVANHERECRRLRAAHGHRVREWSAAMHRWRPPLVRPDAPALEPDLPAAPVAPRMPLRSITAVVLRDPTAEEWLGALATGHDVAAVTTRNAIVREVDALLTAAEGAYTVAVRAELAERRRRPPATARAERPSWSAGSCAFCGAPATEAACSSCAADLAAE